MPFFLVTHTSLVEADNEAVAAQHAVDALRSGCEVSVTVKSDEVTANVVAVAAMSPATVSDATTADTTTDVVSSAVSVEGYPSVEEPIPVATSYRPGVAPTARQVVALGMVVAAIAIWFLI